MRPLRIILEMIKFEHTVFALPFALMSAFFASGGWPSLSKMGWILAAMVGARSCAMAFNRLADATIDAANPRTAKRAIPAELISKSSVWVFTLVSAGLLVLAAWRLNPLAWALSPVALAVIMGYSYAKRFTNLSHVWLGLSLSIAPIGAWIAIRGALGPLPLVLGSAVLLWVAGFDLIYACQDADFDRRAGLFSIPSRFGIRWALILSAGLHVLMMGLLIVLPRFTATEGVRLGVPYGLGLAAVGVLLIYEHAIVKPNDLSRINAAFFTLNGVVSLLLMGVSVFDVLF